MKRLFVTGDSHVEAMKWAFRHSPDKAQFRGDLVVQGLGSGRLMQTPFHSKRDKEIEFLPEEFVENVGTIVQNDALIYCFSMGMHSPSTYAHPMWSTFAPWRVSEMVDATPLSDGVVSEICLATWPHVLAFYEDCLEIGLKFFVVPCPPPRRNHPCFDRGVAIATVMEVDRIFRSTMRNWLSQKGIHSVPEPAGIRDKDGFLKAELCSEHPGDHHHGNIHYGEIMLNAVANDFVNGSFEQGVIEPSSEQNHSAMV